MTTDKTLVDNIFVYNIMITHIYCKNYHQFGLSLCGKLNNARKQK